MDQKSLVMSEIKDFLEKLKISQIDIEDGDKGDKLPIEKKIVIAKQVFDIADLLEKNEP